MATKKAAPPITPPPTVRDKLFAWLYVTVTSHDDVGLAKDVPTAVAAIATALQGQVHLNTSDTDQKTLYVMITNWVTDMKRVQGLHDSYAAVNQQLTTTPWTDTPPHPSIAELKAAFRAS